MSPELLDQIDSAYKRRPRSSLKRILSEVAGTEYHNQKNEPHHLIQPRSGPWFVDSSARLGYFAGRAGISSEVNAGHITGAVQARGTVFPVQSRLSQAGLDLMNVTTVDPDPCQRVLALVRLMDRYHLAEDRGSEEIWLQMLANKELSKLVMTFPSLLHKDFIYEYREPRLPVRCCNEYLRSTARGHMSGSLMEVLSYLPGFTGLPSQLDGFSDQELNSFSKNPIVINSLHHTLWKKSIFSEFPSKRNSLSFVASLLELGSRASLLSTLLDTDYSKAENSDDQVRINFCMAIKSELLESWFPDIRLLKGQLRKSFHDLCTATLLSLESRISTTFGCSEKLNFFQTPFEWGYFESFYVGINDPASELEVSERLTLATESMVRCGFAASNKEAADSVLDTMFIGSIPNKSGFRTRVESLNDLSTGECIEILQAFYSCGVDADSAGNIFKNLGPSTNEPSYLSNWKIAEPIARSRFNMNSVISDQLVRLETPGVDFKESSIQIPRSRRGSL